jgi:hypothetical protein
LVNKTLDPYRNPEPDPYPDSLDMLDPDSYPDSLDMLDPDPYPDAQHCWNELAAW